jgi:outer membrane protein assembly factor BamE (lipoprotein component of BamABCDE complex)
MMRAALLLCVLFAAGCATAPPPPGTAVDTQRAAAVMPGQSTRDSVRALLGPTRSIRFDSGAQVWLYQLPRGGNRFAEFVILFDPAGTVRKTRTREPQASDQAPR